MRKRYPEYKDSGFAWLGEIPSQWNMEKLKFNASVQFSNVDKKSEEGEVPVRLCNYVDVYYNDFITPEIDFMEATASSEEINKFQVKVGDVLVTKDSEEWNDIAIPAFVISDLPNVICGYHLAQIRPNNKFVEGKYLFYYLAAYRTNYQFKIEATGITRYGLGNYALSNSLVVLPSKEEQIAIANFLDRKTAQIDELIAKKERMIELLKEERSAVINHAVTRGLDPNVEMKDSGIDWLGRIPKHWEIKKLKFVVKLKSGESISSDLIQEHDDYPVYGGNGLRGYTNSCTHEGDYVLIGRQGALCGNINYANGKFWASEHAVVVTMLSQGNYFWLGELLRAMNLNQYSQSAAQPGLAVENIQNVYVPFPAVVEQKRIAMFLREKTEQIDAQLACEKKSIELLKEFRTALISEVVTGKINVRD